ncbi:hypothetical protein CAEBREN_02596 [Caenorhabditis brenneri]|uniref:THAP-type domain-containing protein n=1 Tax=Caenorhabditis brenneri TaxID=135651 RepID=G0NAW3_CAEBE|nr:hypothetical protein CAEBREN_02596 [Caenorhabditis brenneri]
MQQEREVTIEYKTENTNTTDKSKGQSNLTSLKRRLLLANQRIVKTPRVKLSSSDSEYQNHLKIYASSGKFPIRISHRLCQICQIIKPIDDIVMLTDEVEKLFILLFALFRKKVIVEATVRLYRQPALYTCYSHFGETSSEILKMFGVTTAVGIFRARQRKVSQVVKFANHMSGKLIEEGRILNFAYLFMLQYPEASAVVGPMIKAEDIPIERTIECHTIETEQIIPKCFRQPRKQRLENEEEGYSSSMLRIIKQEPLNLPATCTPSFQNEYDSSSSVLFQTPIQCCYCLEIREKENMVYIAKTRYRLNQWGEQLGEEFSDRVKSNVINYMCRKHFSPIDFNPRGRLRRAAIPNVVPPPEIHMFKIEGDDFVKVKEEELRDGADEDVEIDIEN